MTPPGTAKLVGLDFGTTTSSGLVADATVRRNAVTGRMEWGVVRETFRSPLVFTPLVGERLDLPATLRLVDEWLDRGGVDRTAGDAVGGGALITGLTARRGNAPGLVAAIRERLGAALVATADDPCLESWVAFQGSCAALSRRHPERVFIHLDIGGGTTNLAYGRGGEVEATGCLFIGARHVRFVAGTRRITALSPHAAAAFTALGIAARPGDDLAAADLDRLLGWYLDRLARAVAGVAIDAAAPDWLGHLQVPFRPPRTGEGDPPVVTLSGGVGELVYAAAAGAATADPTPFGDLGVDLAQRLVAHPAWRGYWHTFVPEGGGRATVAGLLRHATRISGASIHLPDPRRLPLTDLPIVGTLTADAGEALVGSVFDLARRSAAGAAVRVTGITPAAPSVRGFGARIAAALAMAWPPGRPLVLLVGANCGQALGQAATRWGAIDVPLVVIDEIDLPLARWCTLGALRDGVVPVSFHGLGG